MNRKILLVGVAVIVLLLILISPSLFSSTLSDRAHQIIAACAGSTYPPACYNAEIPKLMDQGLSMEEAFKVVSLVTDLTKDAEHSYYFCHVVGHYLSAKETAKDPSAWAKVLERCPVGMCANGCLHGAAQERFRNEALSPEELEKALPELKVACSPSTPEGPTTLTHAFCRHALGHLAVYATDADVPSAVKVCDAVTEDEPFHFRRTCYKGIFMQLFQPLDAEDKALVQDVVPKVSTEVSAFCTLFTGGAQSACNVESWPLYGSEYLASPETLIPFCERVPDALSKTRCYSDSFSALHTVLDYDGGAMTGVCKRFSGEVKELCFAYAAGTALVVDSRLTETAVTLCKAAEEEGVGARCYQELLFYSAYSFLEDSKEFKALCRALPGEWGERCLAKEGKQMLSDIIEDIP